MLFWHKRGNNWVNENTVHTITITPDRRFLLSNTHTRLTALCPGLYWWASTRKVKPICTSLQTDNHANTPPLSFVQARCPSCSPTNSVKALKALLLSNSIVICTAWNITRGCMNQATGKFLSQKICRYMCTFDCKFAKYRPSNFLKSFTIRTIT